MPSPFKHLRLVSEDTTGTRDSVSDETLMLRVGGGDTEAFTDLIDRHQTAIVRFCSGVLGNRQIAEETAQDTFLNLWQYRARYRSNDRFRTYLFTIALNRCRSHLRRRKILSFIGLNTFEFEFSSEVNCERCLQTIQTNATVGSAAYLPLVSEIHEEREDRNGGYFVGGILGATGLMMAVLGIYRLNTPTPLEHAWQLYTDQRALFSTLPKSDKPSLDLAPQIASDGAGIRFLVSF